MERTLASVLGHEALKQSTNFGTLVERYLGEVSGETGLSLDVMSGVEEQPQKGKSQGEAESLARGFVGYVHSMNMDHGYASPTAITGLFNSIVYFCQSLNRVR
jgi:hypothetical protein